MAEKKHIIALNTCPDEATAGTIANKLVESGLAACVNILPAIKSVYCWQGQIEQENEVLLIIKTRKEVFSRLENLIRDNHPYELPEIVAVPIDTGLKEYLNWIDQSLDITK
jgi:periplasmic divalent cation tolerance protein